MDDATEICNAISHYCRGVDDRDFDELAIALADDVVFDMGENSTTSRAEIFEFMQGNFWPPGKHVYANPIIAVDGDTALFLADWFWLDPDKIVGHTGRYSIDLRRAAPKWVISTMRIIGN